MSSRLRTLVVLILLGGSAFAEEPDEHHYLHTEEHPFAAKWGYTGKIGPTHWGNLSPEYVLARTGRSQSPIDIEKPTASNLPPLDVVYHPTKVRLLYDGHTVIEDEDEGSRLRLDGVVYELKQFHFHSPSEHTLAGKHFPLEIHFVHTSEQGAVAVLAVFLKQGRANSALEPIWDNLPSKERPRVEVPITVDTAKLLPAGRGYFRYMGSFTTPPCTEDVKWVVMHQPTTLSAGQLARFRKIVDGNNRPVQPLNGRKVVTNER